MVMSARQTAVGSRVTIAAARSQESSAARNHSRRAYWIASSGSPARSGSRTDPPIRSRISSAVWYRTWSEWTCAASCASTTRRPSSSRIRTSSELSSTIGLEVPIVYAFASGNWVT